MSNLTTNRPRAAAAGASAPWWRSPAWSPRPSGSAPAAAPTTAADSADSHSETSSTEAGQASRAAVPQTPPKDGVVLPQRRQPGQRPPRQVPLHRSRRGRAPGRGRQGHRSGSTTTRPSPSPASTPTPRTRRSSSSAPATPSRCAASRPAFRPKATVPAPASYAVTPVAYTLEELDTDYYAVNLLSYITLTTTEGKVSDGLYAGTQLIRWLRRRLGLAAGPGQRRGHQHLVQRRPAAGGRPRHPGVQAGRLDARSTEQLQ